LIHSTTTKVISISSLPGIRPIPGRGRKSSGNNPGAAALRRAFRNDGFNVRRQQSLHVRLHDSECDAEVMLSLTNAYNGTLPLKAAHVKVIRVEESEATLAVTNSFARRVEQDFMLLARRHA